MTHRDQRYHRFYQIVDLLVEEVLTVPGEDGKPRRKLKGADLEKLKHSVETLVRDSVAINHTRGRHPRASIKLNANAYKHDRYNPHLTYRVHIERAFNGMISLGYLRVEQRGFHSPGKPGLLTRYSATPKLLGLFIEEERKVLPVITPAPRDVETIRVQVREDFDEYGNPYPHRRKVDYEDTEFSMQARANLEIINRALARNWYDLELDDDKFDQMQLELLSKKQRDEGFDRQLNLSKRSLYRVFNDPGFTTGGRFYGGWWQEIPKEYRPNLLVNGKRMVEFDYSSLHPRILYLEEGLDPPGDCYSDILADRVPNEEDQRQNFRSGIKKAVNAMLNARQPLTRPPEGLSLKPYRCKWREMSEAIMQRHHLIAHHFYTGAGSRLQNIDSQITEKVLLHFASKDIPVLPLHDSFLVHHGYATQLPDVMLEAFRQVVGGTAKVDQKLLERVASVWDSQVALQAEDDFGELVTDDLDELLSYMDVGHERRWAAFREMSRGESSPSA